MDKRKVVREQAPSVWGQMPAHLQPGFLEGLPAFASITRPRVATPGKRPRASVANAQQAIEEAFIDAGLRDIPFTEPGDQGGKQEQTAQEKPDAPEIEPDAPEIGWIVHDLPGTDGLSRISSALCGCKSDLDMAAQSTSVPDEQGNVSAAHGVLTQALSFARAVQLQQPVLLCETLGDNAIALAFACPCGQGANSEPPLTNANGCPDAHTDNQG